VAAREIVVDHDLVTAAQERDDGMAADVARASRDEHLQDPILRFTGVGILTARPAPP
jgi:hypothetical protein